MAAYTTIDDPGAYFNTVLWTGNATTSTAITGVGFQPDMTWIKERSQTRSHVLFDVVRGATVQLNPNDSASDATVAESLQSFDADGFTVGDATSVNESGETYVGWNWKKTADAGFDIVSYTGNDTARTIAHSLSAVPKVIMPKSRSDAYEWRLYHAGNTSAPETDFIVLNENYATTDQANAWNDTAPTSSVFSLGTGETPNNDGTTYITYLWAEKQGYSKFSSFVGNGADDGIFCFTGHRPAMVLLKGTADNREWIIFNNKTNTFNPIDSNLYPNGSSAENTGTDRIDFLSNGFKLRDGAANYNNSGDTYIYMSFAEAPFVNSNGVPCNAR